MNSCSHGWAASLNPCEGEMGTQRDQKLRFILFVCFDSPDFLMVMGEGLGSHTYFV